MINNYLKIAFRNLRRHKLYTSINIFGLAVGLALCLIIVGNISYELSFEENHENLHNIYRLNSNYISGEEEIYSAAVMAPLGPVIMDELSEVEKAAVFRISNLQVLEIDDERIKVVDPYRNAAYAHHKNIIFAKPDFLDVFSMPLIQGNPRSALAEPFSMLITEKAALEYFETPNPVGGSVLINDRFECQVVGILKDIPQNTQIYCDFMVSYSTLDRIGENTKSWSEFGTDYVYLLLSETAEPLDVESKLPAILKNHLDTEEAGKYTFSLQPLKDIYFTSLSSMRQNELNPMGEPSVIFAYGIVALFILLQAIANFINLSTARSADRMREVGVRKVFGAFRWHLIRQFLGESVIIAFFAMLIGIVAYEVFKVQISELLPREMLIDCYKSPTMLLSVIALIAIVGIIAGYYPALYLSKFKPVAILQGKSSIKSSKYSGSIFHLRIVFPQSGSNRT